MSAVSAFYSSCSKAVPSPLSCSSGNFNRQWLLTEDALHGVQDLRKENARKIAEARAQAPEWIDPGGYDMVVLPEGATVKQDGSKMRVFTKSDYRKLLSTAQST